jgi:hypothetical protein
MNSATHSVPARNKPDATAGRPRRSARFGLLLLPAAGLAAMAISGCVTQSEPPPATYTQYIGAPSAPPAPDYYPPQPAPAPPPPAPAPVAADPLDQLMGPVALYPDPLISILLPASTFPADIQSAGAYLAQGGDPSQVDGQPWDQSVRALAHYPQVVSWMAQNLPWTQAVGAAFVSEPAQVMEAIQRLRELAQAAGTLASSPQEEVVVDSSYIEIMPAQPGIIYVPQYDPQVVYVDQPYYSYDGPYCTWGPAYGAGVWLTFGANWRGGGVLVVDHGYWGDSHGWSHDPYARVNVNITISVNGGGGPRPWAFPPGRPRPQAPANWQANAHVVSVHPAPGAPPRPPQAAYRNIHTRGPAAVAVVSANPAAFKGRPINAAIMPRTNPAAARPQSTVPRPATNEAYHPTGVRPEATHPAPAPKPAVTPYKEAPEHAVAPGHPEVAAPRAPVTKPEEPRVEAPARPKTETVTAPERGPVAPRGEVRPDDGKEPEKDPKKVVKPKPKPTPERKEEERKPDDNPH